MKNRHRNLLAITLALFTGCGTHVPSLPDYQTSEIRVGPGPEDMVLDSLQGDPRLIISCAARREVHEPYGEIMAYDLESGRTTLLVRYHEPPGLRFRPHGIFLDRDMLYVISHEREPDYHPVLAYRLHGDSLEFRELIHTPLQHSPNALATGPGGAIYLVNDSGKRGSIWEKALKLRRASLVKLWKESDGMWKSESLATRLGYPAGINRIGTTLYVGDAILHRIHVFELTGGGAVKAGEIRGIRGNDNLRIHQGQILVPGHVKPFKFIKHTKDPEKLSPVEVFLVDPRSGKSTTLYYTDGSAISAGSTALIHKNDLYICQVFDPFILKVDLDR